MVLTALYQFLTFDHLRAMGPPHSSLRETSVKHTVVIRYEGYGRNRDALKAD